MSAERERGRRSVRTGAVAESESGAPTQWCRLHEQPHREGGMICEQTSAESWWAEPDDDELEAILDERAEQHRW